MIELNPPILKNQNQNQSLTQLAIFPINEINKPKMNIEAIISGDKIKELQELIQEKDIKTFTTITKSFMEVEKMKIPLIEYCIIK